MDIESGRTYSELLYAPRRLRLNQATIALIIWATLIVIVCLGVGFPLAFVAIGLGCIGAVLSAARAFRIRLLVTKDIVRIDNYWRSYEFPWSGVTFLRIGLTSVLPQPALGFGLDGSQLRVAQAAPFRATERQAFQAAVLALAPPRVRAVPDAAGIIGSEKALSNLLRRWWMKGQPRQMYRFEGDRMVWIEQPLFAPLRRATGQPQEHPAGPGSTRQ